MSDLISRQAAIKAADSIIERDTSGNNDVVKAMTAWKEYIKALPAAQPEIIRCKDCEHWTNDDCPFAWGKVEDAFCSYAERRTDG